MDVNEPMQDRDGIERAEACTRKSCGVCPVCPSTYIVPLVLLALLVGTLVGAGEDEIGTWLIGGVGAGLALWIGVGLYRALRLR